MDKDLIAVLQSPEGKKLLGHLILKFKVADTKVNTENVNAMYHELGQKSVIRYLLNEVGMTESGIEKAKNIIKYED